VALGGGVGVEVGLDCGVGVGVGLGTTVGVGLTLGVALGVADGLGVGVGELNPKPNAALLGRATARSTMATKLFKPPRFSFELLMRRQAKS
jgi:hypothetical protein